MGRDTSKPTLIITRRRQGVPESLEGTIVRSYYDLLNGFTSRVVISACHGQYAAEIVHFARIKVAACMRGWCAWCV